MNIALIVASGKGTRIKEKVTKLFLPINGKPLLYYTIAAFYDHPEIDKIVITTNTQNQAQIKNILSLSTEKRSC